VTVVEPTDELGAAARQRVERHEAPGAQTGRAARGSWPVRGDTTSRRPWRGESSFEAVPEDLDLKRDVFGTLGAAAETTP